MNSIENLKEISRVIRKDIVEMLTESASGHPGGSLSIADIIATLYFKEMNIDVKNPKDENRDRFVLSKGACSTSSIQCFSKKGIFWC